MAAKKTFLESMGPLDARMQLAALVLPRELLSLSAASKRLRSALYGNRSPLRASLESHYRAQQTVIIDLLNAPKADSKDTFDARYGCCVSAGGFLAKLQPVKGYAKHCDDTNRARRLELVATWETFPDAPRIAWAAAQALKKPPVDESRRGDARATFFRRRLTLAACGALDFWDARRFLQGLEEDSVARAALEAKALTYTPVPVEALSTTPASSEEDTLKASQLDYYFHKYADRAGGMPAIIRRLQRSRRPPSSEPFDTSFVERVADAFQLDGLARWVFIAAAELRVGDLAVRGACGVINRFEFLHGCHMPSWQGFWEDLRHPDLGLFPEAGKGGAIQKEVVRALCIMAAATMSPQTFKRHCCFFFRNAMRRCFGVHAREFVTALHGAAGADMILERMEQGQGHALRAVGERSDGHAHDSCNMLVLADPRGGVGRYRIVQNQVGAHSVLLASGLTLKAAREVVLSFEFDASIEYQEPSDWPAGVWWSFKLRDAWKWGTGGLRTEFVKRVRYVEEESPLYAPYRKYPLLGLYRFQVLNGIHQTLENVRECAPGFDASYKEDENKKRPYDAYRRYKVGGPRSRRDARIARGRADCMIKNPARRAAADAGLQTDVETTAVAARRQKRGLPPRAAPPKPKPQPNPKRRERAPLQPKPKRQKRAPVDDAPMREKLIKWKLSGCTVAVTPVMVPRRP
jgi:hypothetical protein